MKNILSIITIVLILILGFIFVITNRPEPVTPLGSVARSGEYHSVLTGASSGGSDTLQLTTEPATLGSIIITATGGAITVYNATTSNVTLRAGATTTLDFVNIPSGTAVGTYVYDLVLPHGLLVVLEGTQATSTITYR